MVPQDTEHVGQILAEIENGHGLTLAAAARVMGGTDPSTVYRFIRRGSRDQAGQVVHLEAIRLGSRWWTTRPAILRYTAAISRSDRSSPAKLRHTPAKNESHAAVKLRALGC